MTMPVAGVGTGGAAGAYGASGSLVNLSANEFLTLLVTELQNQNPLSPMDPTQMVQQTSSLSMVELLSTIQSALGQLTSTEGVLQAAGLIGQSVTYQSGQTQEAGTVEGVGQSANGVVLDVGGQSVPIANVLAVGLVPAGATTAAGTSTTSTSQGAQMT
jgi:flagellar basal-body rod modification protein FlgD